MSGGIDDFNKKEDASNLQKNPETNPVPEQAVSPDEIKELGLWYENLQKNPDFVSKLKNQYEWDKSLTWLLANNEQIQLLLDDILSNYWNYIRQDETVLKKVIEKKKNHESNNSIPEQWQIVECFEEYLLNNDSQEWFEQFLLSNWCIKGVILSYIQDHAVGTDWKINTDLISKNNIKAKIKAERHKKMYMDYNEQYGLEPNDKLEKLMNFWESVKNTVDWIVSEYLSKWMWDEQFLRSLEWLLDNEFIKKIIKPSEKVEEMNESDQNYREKVNFLLRNSIKEYSRLLNIWNENRTLQKTNDDKVFDTQLRSYLFLYWKIFYPDIFKSGWWKIEDYEWELWKILEAILVSDWKLDKTENNEWKNKYIQAEDKCRTGFRNIESHVRRSPRRPRWRNHPEDKGDIQVMNNIENRNLDIQNASWVEIAQEMELWKSLEWFKMNETLQNSDMIFRGRTAFRKTCSEFIAKNWERLKKSGVRISDLFYFDNNNFGVAINNVKWKELEEKLGNTEFNEVKSLMNQFIREFNDNLKDINQNFDNKKEDVHNVVKEYAIWAVIDNVKDMFQNIIETSNEWDFLSWFEFDEKKSAKIENNNLIISGKFNWENLIIKYDLNNGSLYMNAYISRNESWSIIVWDNSPKQKIWELKPFQGILDDFYESPTESMSNDVFPRIRRTWKPGSKPWENSNDERTRPRRSPRRGIEARKRMKEEHKRKLQEICGTKIDEINWNIKNVAESKTTQDFAVSNLLKTLNVMPESNNLNKAINLEENSDLYKVVQTITNSENDDISYFSNYLWKLMKYVWLKWWENNLLWQDKTTEDARFIFNNGKEEEDIDENKNDDTICYLRKKTKNFNEEYKKMDGNVVFDSWSSFWILSVINEKFVEGTPPNWKLKKNIIEDFDTQFSKDLIHYEKIMNQQENMNTYAKVQELIAKRESTEQNPDEKLEEELSTL